MWTRAALAGSVREGAGDGEACKRKACGCQLRSLAVGTAGQSRGGWEWESDPGLHED